MEISFPSEFLGEINSDLNSRRGQVLGIEPTGSGMQIIKANIPLAEVAQYSRVLQGLTAGQGSFSMKLSHYEPVSFNDQQKIIEAAQRNPS